MSRRGLFKNNSPLVKEEVYRRPDLTRTERVMTVRGAVDKTILLFSILLVSAIFAWQTANPALAIVGSIGGLVAVVVNSFKLHLSPILAPVTAIFEGLLVGSISYLIAGAYGAIVFQAVTMTLAVLFIMLMIYKSGLIKVTDRFKIVIMTSMGGIFLVYMLSFVLSFFGISLPYLHSTGPIGIGISLFVIVIASLMLLVNFDFIEKGAEAEAPDYMEWYGAIGVIITLVWIYIEILRLLSIFSRD